MFYSREMVANLPSPRCLSTSLLLRWKRTRRAWCRVGTLGYNRHDGQLRSAEAGYDPANAAGSCLSTNPAALRAPAGIMASPRDPPRFICVGGCVRGWNSAGICPAAPPMPPLYDVTYYVVVCVCVSSVERLSSYHRSWGYPPRRGEIPRRLHPPIHPSTPMP